MKRVRILRLLSIIIVLSMVIVSLMSCATKSKSKGDFSGVTIRLSLQYGMQYVPAYVVQEKKLLEKYLPGINVEWSNLGGGSVMSEALIAGQLDVAFMGLPPAIIAWDKGADFKIACGICVPPSELMVGSDSGISTLADFTESDKIAVPSVGSIQHIMLARACKTILGDANALDNNIVAMSNPNAYSSLLSGTEIVAHFASMPYIDTESEDGFTSILSGKDAYGDASIICVVSKQFYETQPLVYSALIQALSEAIQMINSDDPEVTKIVSKVENISEEKAAEYLVWPGTNYSTNVYGAMGLAEFMSECGYISKTPESAFDLMWPSAAAMVGKRLGGQSEMEIAQYGN